MEQGLILLGMHTPYAPMQSGDALRQTILSMIDMLSELSAPMTEDDLRESWQCLRQTMLPGGFFAEASLDETLSSGGILEVRKVSSSAACDGYANDLISSRCIEDLDKEACDTPFSNFCPSSIVSFAVSQILLASWGPRSGSTSPISRYANS